MKTTIITGLYEAILIAIYAAIDGSILYLFAEVSAPFAVSWLQCWILCMMLLHVSQSIRRINESLSRHNVEGMAPGSAVPDSESINQAGR